MVNGKVLSRAFFARHTLTVAREMIGKYLIRQDGDRLLAGRIIEVEAYRGAEDKACHASKGRTPRTEVLYGPPGHAYVYLCYGIHEMLNVVTEEAEFPAAVLVRAVKHQGRLLDGPGRVTRALVVDRRHNRFDVTEGRDLWFEDRGEPIPQDWIRTYPRIGVEYAGDWAMKPWRFRLRDPAAMLEPGRRGSSTRSRQ